MRMIRWSYAILFLSGMGVAHAGCDSTQVSETGVTGALSILIKTVMPNPSVAPCASLASVLNKLASRGKTGGRRLEDEKPLDPLQAQAELQKALSDPEIRARLEKIREDVQDEDARLVYEAAILDEEGYYDARELKIQQLQRKLD